MAVRLVIQAKPKRLSRPRPGGPGVNAKSGPSGAEAIPRSHRPRATTTSIDGRIRPPTKSEPPLATDGDIESLAPAVLAGTHAYSNWTHLAHCALTIFRLRDRLAHGLEQTTADIIRNDNRAVGVANTATSGDHETLTIFCLRAIRDFLDRECTGLGLAQAVAALEASPLGQGEFVFNYYSYDRLFDPERRGIWQQPDLQPLPF